MRQDIKFFLSEYAAKFNQLKINVHSLILFGSQARGEASVSSDIDIAVVMDKKLSPLQRGQLLSLGDEIDIRYKVNLFFTNCEAVAQASSVFDTNKYIREEGIVLWQS